MQTETARLRLRPFTPADLEDLSKLYADAEVMRFIGKSARSKQESELSLTRLIGHWPDHGFGMWAVHTKDDGRFVGRCGLQPMFDSREVELGYTFHREFWGQGLATEGSLAAIQHGFDNAGLSRIVAIARPENRASWRVMEKIGMTYERTAPSPYDRIDVVWYGISREGYRQFVDGGGFTVSSK